jgi:carboxypeptidase T
MKFSVFGIPILVLSSQVLAASGTIPNYPCYRIVESMYQTAEDIANRHPNLAEWIDVGDSWEKTADEGGYDIKVLKLTNKNIPGPKPALFTTSSIHAREYATAELMTRFAETLVDGYGKDPDITWMLDYHEAHLLLVFNPDGRKRAEANVMWRKNTNRNYCGNTSRNRGVDLNRNFDYRFGDVGSSNQCSETYRGPSAASEPETQAVQNYLRSLFEDRRGDDQTLPVPLDTQGIYLDIHSYGEIIYQPRRSPNDYEITTLNRKLSYFNGYRPILNFADYQQELKGTVEDDYESHFLNYTYAFGYGDLGVASYLIELGRAFFQNCNYFRDNILQQNLAALTYALKVVSAPYQLPSGPDSIEIATESISATRMQLKARVTDKRYSSRSGQQTTADILSAEYTVNMPPWKLGAVGQALQAEDGQFDSPDEVVHGFLDPSLLGTGKHTIYVQGTDKNSHKGPVSAIFIEIP